MPLIRKAGDEPVVFKSQRATSHRNGKRVCCRTRAQFYPSRGHLPLSGRHSNSVQSAAFAAQQPLTSTHTAPCRHGPLPSVGAKWRRWAGFMSTPCLRVRSPLHLHNAPHDLHGEDANRSLCRAGFHCAGFHAKARSVQGAFHYGSVQIALGQHELFMRASIFERVRMLPEPANPQLAPRAADHTHFAVRQFVEAASLDPRCYHGKTLGPQATRDTPWP